MSIQAKVDDFLDSLTDEERVAAIELFRARILRADLRALKDNRPVVEKTDPQICGGIIDLKA